MIETKHTCGFPLGNGLPRNVAAPLVPIKTSQGKEMLMKSTDCGVLTRVSCRVLRRIFDWVI